MDARLGMDSGSTVELDLVSEQDRRDLVSIEALVRGIKFYSGVKDLGTFVHVTFAREYTNTNDRNSVLVYLKSNREFFGHLDRSVAAGVAEIMVQIFQN